MKLNQLAAKPQLTKFLLDDKDIVKEFGEPLEFYSYDRQPLDVFMRLANANQQDMGQMIDIVRTLILDEDGKQIITGDAMLPSKVLIACIAKIVDTLGK
jgi:hypothetical protein